MISKYMRSDGNEQRNEVFVELNYWFYLKNIFINPSKASRIFRIEKNWKRVAGWSFISGGAAYIFIVLIGYATLGWDEFPYKQYYPYYFSPYWWEVLAAPIWGIATTLACTIPAYFFGRLFGGKGSFNKVLTIVLLASLVSLPIMVIIAFLTSVNEPQRVIDFAIKGESFVPYEQGEDKLLWYAATYYFAVAYTWQGIVTLIGLSKIHRIKWYKNIPGVAIGTYFFFLFLILIRDYVALIV